MLANLFQQKLQRHSSIGNKTFSKKPQASQNFQLQYSKIIKGHNKRVTSKPRDQRPKCNSRKKAECPMEGNFLVNVIVYKWDVARPLPKKVYLGLAEGEWKSRFYDHKLSFKHKRHSNKTTLSSYMWRLKKVSSETLNLKCSVLRCVPPYSNISKNASCVYMKNWTLLIKTRRNSWTRGLNSSVNVAMQIKFLLKNWTGNDFR